MKIKKYFLLVALGAIVSIQSIYAQVDNDVPANAEPGKCYARCYVPDQYDQQTTQIIDRQASQKIIIIPATYETVIDTILEFPARLETKVVPPEYQMVAETIMVAATTTKWVKGNADASCLNENPDNCRVLCLVQIPAQYKVQSARRLVTPAYTQQIEIPASYKYMPRKVLKTEETQQALEIPATFKTVTQNILVKKGGFSEWKEVLCANQLTEQRITMIQKALLDKGYNPGPIDNIFGPQTKSALLKYQIDNNLPQGNLNLETLTSLGVQ
jgi:hypothetical protein